MAKVLALSNYQPNFNDPRTFKRVSSAIDWCKTYLSDDWARPMSHKMIDEAFGPRCSDLSKWLKYKLLFKLGSYKVGTKSMELLKYQINKEGFDKVVELLNKVEINPTATKSRRKKLEEAMKSSANTNELEFQHLFDKFGAQLELNQFDYNHSDITGRDYHGLQMMKREDKPIFWSKAGYYWNYDIESCAPTLLSQYAEQLGLSSLLTEHIGDYINNKSYHRNRLSKLLEIDEHVVKEILNSLFNGARLSANTHCAAYAKLDYDIGKMITLQNDAFIIKLRRSISYCWKRIQTEEKALKGKSKRWMRGEKWNIYFKLEKEIMRLIYVELDEMNVNYFNEHDGFRTKEKIDTSRLEEIIEKETNMKIKIKEEMIKKRNK